MNFTKMHALKNDYILLDLIKNPEYEEKLIPDFIKKICERKSGIGSDGLVLILPNLVFRMFNPDGTEAEACANGLRVYAQYVFDKGYTDKETEFKVKLHMTGEFVDLKITKDTVRLKLNSIEYLKQEKIDILKNSYKIFFFKVPNPHAVVFVSETLFKDEFIFSKINFDYKSYNLNLVNFDKENNILNLRTYERGAGETLSCGTGASASSVASFIKNNVDNYLVRMRGGEAKIKVKQYNKSIFIVNISSNVFYVYQGTILVK